MRSPTLIGSSTMMKFVRKSLFVLLCFGGGVVFGSEAAPLSYNRDIRPILSDNCFSCHGPDSAKRESGLRLDLRESATSELDSGGIAIVPGDLEASALIARIVSDDDDLIMPPPSAHKKLNDDQKQKLRRWIAEGAPYEKHWSFIPLRPVPIPDRASIEHATEEQLAWPRNPIDWFVLKRMVESGLSPSPPAESPTLARRIALDLIGLPPMPEQVAAFHEDDLDQYIATFFKSPHYGERMAVDWLDAARYADTQGYQVDRDQDMHLWRDWVISAYNANMPFDQFTIEQLAGDLLGNPTESQKIATGFHRNHMVNVEGGIIPAEFIAEYTADRVETTATVWMGQTFNCCRCHNHKFDPFTQKDFYSLKAFFNSVGEQGDGSQDTLVTRSPEIEAQLTPLRNQIAALERKIDLQPVEEAEVRVWADRLVKQPVAWQRFEIAEVDGSQGKPKLASDLKSFDLARVSREGKPFIVSVKVPRGAKVTAVKIECSSEAESVDIDLRRVTVTRNKKNIRLLGAEEGESKSALDATKHLAAKPAGTTKFQPGPNKPPETLVWELADPLTIDTDDATLRFSLGIVSANQPSEWQFLYSEGSNDQLVAQKTLDLAAKEPSKLSKKESIALQGAYRLSRPDAKEMKFKIDSLTDRVTALRRQEPVAFIMDELEKPRETFVLMRGVYDKPADKVVAAVPEVLPPLSSELPVNRLGLARWLVSPEHPLTARVTVNRLWQSIFGTGLVKTSDDFGSQGEAPSHPELLDWLAGEFIRSGWDVQHMQRLILTSATYRQSSRFHSKSASMDIENRFLARGPRFRLHAEFVRDQALFVSGLLTEKIGGKSVKPYHPTGLYELVTAGSTTNVYTEDKGEALYRRSLYTYWKRSVPHPAMMIFDASGREVCSMKRPRSNTPLQALNLMNDPIYIESARHLAKRMIDSSDDIRERIRFGYRVVLSREPSAREIFVFERAYDRTRSDFENDPHAMKGLLTTGSTASEIDEPADLAAMTSLCSTLLCLDETITKE